MLEISPPTFSAREILSDRSTRYARSLREAWDRYEGPTWIIAIVLYASWSLLIAFHAVVPWWLMCLLGAYITAWHSSLQHETIHSLKNVPLWVRNFIASPPLGLLYPYAIYNHEHRRHHRNSRITDPREDPESLYHTQEQWRSYTPFIRGMYLFNQTLIGRLSIGPPLSAVHLLVREVRRVIGGDRSNLLVWGRHAGSVCALFFVISGIAGMPWWEYVLFFAYAGTGLSMLRGFIEHRWAPDHEQRTAIVETTFPFALLFLNNNLHVIHHAQPALPWYRIPAVYAARRQTLMERNRTLFFRGYSEIARRWFFAPAFIPSQPEAL